MARYENNSMRLIVRQHQIQGSQTEPGKASPALGGFVSNVDLFDPLEFGISQKEAQYLDPSLRLTLEAAHQVPHFLPLSHIPQLTRRDFTGPGGFWN